MCGIAGVWAESDLAPVREMIAVQAHRGPDGHGFHDQAGQGLLGHTRLAIIDPAHGQQPIDNETRSSVIVANGEVYNHADLRRNLARDHRFGSTSDIETVLHLFEEQGLDAVPKLDGMFALAIADQDALLLARDPIGIKPLYVGYKQTAGDRRALYFASELKALVKWADDVEEFPPGTYFHSQQGFRRYYTVPKLAARPEVPVAEQIRAVRATLEAAVTKRLMSDVPLGAFLSGGLDSSIIAALARRQMDELHTFSVGIEGSRDLAAARLVAEHIGSTHHEYIYTAADVLAALPEVLYYLESFDQDLVRSAIPTYFCSRLAAEHVKVILTGEGADELFAGYTYYKEIDDVDALHHELHRSVTSLHNLNLQRVDRMNMRHSIEGRVPFLDTALVELAQTIPANRKLRRTPDGRQVEKWILRKAVEDLLPAEIVWRAKEQFDEGSGTVDLLDQVLHDAAADLDWRAYAAAHPADRLRSREECYYHQLLSAAFPAADREKVLRNVGRWKGQD
ncbi:MAG: asparagine synthase B [Caldilineaceae bacterium]|nr:asparagine synthase B [Caldilineaceae bacterium]